MMDLAPQWKLISFWRLSRRQMSDFEHQHYQRHIQEIGKTLAPA